MPRFIIKRNGDLVPFDQTKIQNALIKAFIATKEIPEKDIPVITEKLTNQVVLSTLSDNPTVEEIQDNVEKCLMDDYKITAKCYILYREEHKKQRTLSLALPLDPLYGSKDKDIGAKGKAIRDSAKYFDDDTMRQFVYFRTYARWLDHECRREGWVETVDRYMGMMRKQLQNKLTEDEYGEIRQAILHQEVMPSMRLLQMAGPAAERENLCAYNCSYIAPTCFQDLAEIMYLSMCGTGVGWSVENKYIALFPPIASSDVIGAIGEKEAIPNYTIEDSREGWCHAFSYGLHQWAQGREVNFDYSNIRKEGARLKTTGGRASGPKPLIELMNFTHEVFKKRAGSRLTSTDVYDIICYIGRIVVTGGVRRSAMISLSDLSDNEIRDAKVGNFWLTNPQRSMANNSAVYLKKPSSVKFMEEWLALAKSGCGERGIFNRGSIQSLIPARRIELMGKEVDWGVNPCSEVILQSKQLCNLTEVVCRSHDTLDSLVRKIRLASILGTYQATLDKFNFVSPDWKKHQESERLLGVSLTGQFDCPLFSLVGGTQHQVSKIFSSLRETAISVNKIYAKRFGINPATAVTSVKPSGTVSQLVNASSGVHPRFSPYYIRRIRISATDPLLQLMKAEGYPCYAEVGQDPASANTFVLEFPVSSRSEDRELTGALGEFPVSSKDRVLANKNIITAENVTAMDQLEYWLLVKQNYAEHSVSQTIYVREHEWLDVGKWVWDHWEMISGLSFLPYSDHVYDLAPYQSIDEKKYLELSSRLPKVDFSKLIHYEKEDRTEQRRELACTGDKCEL